jgi:hypothetical protein
MVVKLVPVITMPEAAEEVAQKVLYLVDDIMLHGLEQMVVLVVEPVTPQQVHLPVVIVEL